MKSIKNRVQLLGLVGKIIGISDSEKVKKIARLSLITSDQYPDKNGVYVIESSSHLLIAIGNIAEIIEKGLSRVRKYW